MTRKHGTHCRPTHGTGIKKKQGAGIRIVENVLHTISEMMLIMN